MLSDDPVDTCICYKLVQLMANFTFSPIFTFVDGRWMIIMTVIISLPLFAGNSPPEAEIACGCSAKEVNDFVPSGDEYCLLSINEIINGKVNNSMTVIYNSLY